MNTKHKRLMVSLTNFMACKSSDSDTSYFFLGRGISAGPGHLDPEKRLRTSPLPTGKRSHGHGHEWFCGANSVCQFFRAEQFPLLPSMSSNISSCGCDLSWQTHQNVLQQGFGLVEFASVFGKPQPLTSSDLSPRDRRSLRLTTTDK
jgi:hypothetical protein